MPSRNRTRPAALAFGAIPASLRPAAVLAYIELLEKGYHAELRPPSIRSESKGGCHR